LKKQAGARCATGLFFVSYGSGG